MTHHYNDVRRHAHNTLADVNRHLTSGKIRNPRHHYMLTDMMEKATRTLDNLDRMDDRRHMDYNDKDRTHGDRYNRYNDHMRNDIGDITEAINRTMDKLDDYADDVEMARGRARRVRVGGYTRRAPRADMDDWGDRHDRAENRRRRDSRGRFIRAEMDDWGDDDRMDDITRAAADTAARTARNMRNDHNDYNDRADRYNREDRGDYYPTHPPVMPRHDADRTADDRSTAIGPGRR